MISVMVYGPAGVLALVLTVSVEVPGLEGVTEMDDADQ
jgi:hypothetical protein